jgi:hypothetical protein
MRDSSHRSSTMPRHAVLVGVASLARASANAAVQPKPNFAGKWTLVSCRGCADSSNLDALRARGNLAPGWAADGSIVQDDAKLTIVDGAPKGELRTVYSLDDQPRKLATAGPHGTVNIAIRTSDLLLVQSKAKWLGDSLVIPVTGTTDSTSVAFTMTVFLDRAGYLTAEWAVRGIQLRANGFHIDFSSAQGPGFHGSGPIALKYKRESSREQS